VDGANQESLKQARRATVDVVKLRNEKWLCPACGAETDSDDWTLKSQTSRRFTTKEDYLVIVCPKCKGSSVYQYSHHVHFSA
jgi:predicted RNA-binding Zn-ribbon protein involved in translation (DUF1610 family)